MFWLTEGIEDTSSDLNDNQVYNALTIVLCAATSRDIWISIYVMVKLSNSTSTEGVIPMTAIPEKFEAASRVGRLRASPMS